MPKGHDAEGTKNVLLVGALISLFAWSATPIAASLEVLLQKAAEGVIAYFEQLLAAIPDPSAGWSGGAAAARAGVPPLDPFALLGVAPTATDAELKAAYREQLKLNHPDKVAHLSRELQQVALERTQAIRQAFDTIENPRGRS